MNAPAPHAASAHDIAGRIGPNSITRMAEAIDAACGRATTERIFAAAGLSACLSTPPTEMVDEAWVTRLHAALRHELPAELCARIGRDAGRRTGDYLLAVRIPKPAQAILRVTPAPLAARILVAAIGKHAWTFAGSGAFSVRFGAAEAPLLLTIAHGPICRDAHSATAVCDFYAGTFARIFGELVRRGTTVEEIRCEAKGDPECVFAVRW